MMVDTTPGGVAMKTRSLLSTVACGILLLVGLPAIQAGEPSSGPHAWKDVTGAIEWEGKRFVLYPEMLTTDPGLPSPYSSPDGIVTVTARLRDGTFALVPAMLTEGQRLVNGEEFPDLARTGLHAEPELLAKRVITGRSIEEVTRLGRPGGLSGAGFMAADEDIISVLVGDNGRVKALGLTHPELAEPLFHVINMMETDIGIVWRNHSWDDLKGLTYNGREIFLKGKGTKGGQKSIFDDGIEGAWDLDIWREPDEQELAFLHKSYEHLEKEAFGELVERLSRFHTGEMVPQYIMRYGFYEGHTDYRADPIVIAFIFGLSTVEEIEAAFPGRLPETLTRHHRSEEGTARTFMNNPG
jgi:hypothetical protein